LHLPFLVLKDVQDPVLLHRLEPVEKRFMSFSMAFKPMVIRTFFPLLQQEVAILGIYSLHYLVLH